MKVKEFIKWLETQNQELEVDVLEAYIDEDWHWSGGYEVRTSELVITTVPFDDPNKQSSTTEYSLILGIEK